MKIIGILQARVSSSRLPKKILLPVLGKPLLQLQIERIKRSQKIDELILATSTDPSDNELEPLCSSLGMPIYRGSLENVLDRFYQTAKKYKADQIVRLTGDCPLADPELIDELIEFHLQGKFDFSSNAREPTYPDGLDAAIFSFSSLEAAWKNAKTPAELEHVTLYFNRNLDKFKIGSMKGTVDHSAERWTVDEQRDYEFVKKVYEALYPNNAQFTTKEILNYLNANPSVRALNQNIQRNEGLKKSLDAESKGNGSKT